MKHLGYNFLGYVCGWVALKMTARVKAFKEGYKEGRILVPIVSDIEKEFVKILKTKPVTGSSLIATIKQYRSKNGSSLIDAKNHVESLIEKYKLKRIEIGNSAYYS